VPEKVFQDLVMPNLPNPFTNNIIRSGTNVWPGLLTNEKFKTVLPALQATLGVEVLGEPEATTISGLETQIRMTHLITVVTNVAYTNFNFYQSTAPATNTYVLQTETVEIGPCLNVVPYVMADGYTINLSLIPVVTNFLGYDKTTNSTVAYINRTGEKINTPRVLPRYTVRRVVTTVNLWDGQTAVVSDLPETDSINGKLVTQKPKSSDKKLLVFITANIVDPAGNRIHSDEDMPFAKTGIPPQPPK
jgi:Flp pilus assembly secretin CpaC